MLDVQCCIITDKGCGHPIWATENTDQTGREVIACIAVAILPLSLLEYSSSKIATARLAQLLAFRRRNPMQPAILGHFGRFPAILLKELLVLELVNLYL